MSDHVSGFLKINNFYTMPGKISDTNVAQRSLSIKIADIIIRVDSSSDFKEFNDFGFYQNFLTKENLSPHCRLDHHIGLPPEFRMANDPFTTQNWQLSNIDGQNVLRLGPPPKRGLPDNVVVFNADYSHGQMYQNKVFELFRRFIDQFIIINLLSRNNGFLLHASGVIWEGKGLCFVGPSGAGKSTLLNLFGKELSRESLLNDDRVALRRAEKSWRVFGTPWYGESRVSSSGAAPLSALFFIRHAKNNYVRPLSAGEVCEQLMVQSLVPVWDAEATARVLGIFQDLILNIPAFELGFLPDKSAIELIKKTI